MTPIRSVKNQYRGINAHLHSLLQVESEWGIFHNAHITHLADRLAAQLRPLGYMADIEQSLQIRRLDDYSLHKPKADVLIEAHQPVGSTTFGLAVLDMPLEDLLMRDEEHPYNAIVVYERAPKSRRGDPVVWIELLSPTNKGDTPDAHTYSGKRQLLLESGLVFLELDYLHETPPTFESLSDYTEKAQQTAAHPYRIIIIDPRPDIKHGRATIKGFNVDVPIPELRIPLLSGASCTFDFGIPYQDTFERRFFGDNIDYASLPLNFERYSAADQARIARRMLAVLRAARAGVDLDGDTIPLPVDETLTLDDALKQLEQLKNA